MATAVYPGSFDPVTKGHLDIIKRAAKINDHLIVAVLNNSAKNPLFTVEERVELLKECCKGIQNVSVESFDGLTVEFAKKRHASVMVLSLIHILRAASRICCVVIGSVLLVAGKAGTCGLARGNVIQKFRVCTVRNDHVGTAAGHHAVSYTHLDVYKRQVPGSRRCRSAVLATAPATCCMRRSRRQTAR